jgi:hypothetical protein
VNDMSILYWLSGLMLLAQVPPPQIGPFPDQWRGTWASTGETAGDLQLVRVRAETVQLCGEGL